MSALTPPPGPLVAVVLAGGRARRLGGVDKPRLDIEGASALERVLAASGTPLRIVVGPAGDGSSSARVVQEDPPFGGPVAALVRALAEVPALLAEHGAADDDPASAVEILVLAGDMPLLRAEHVRRLRAAGEGVRVMVSAQGRREHLCAVWPLPALRGALARIDPGGDGAGRAMKELYATPEAQPLHEVPALADETADLDTPEDLTALRARLRGAPEEGESPVTPA